MKFTAFLLLSGCLAGCLFCDMCGAATEVWALPGTQGVGAETQAGRGGRIIAVKNLNDAGPGSLRQAIETAGPRIVVFEVSGTIVLRGILRVTSPFLTIAGQTAPSPGITIQGRGCLDIRTHDVLIQHLRFRATSRGAWNDTDIDYFDGFQITGSSGYPPYKAYNVVIDHVSASGAMDEGCSIWCAGNVTISNSIIALSDKGVLIGNNSQDVLFVGNLVMHNKTRQPRVNCGVSANIIGNIFYNGPEVQMQIGESKATGGYTSKPYPVRPTMINVVGNLFVSGPRNIKSSRHIKMLYANKELNAKSKIFLKNNLVNGAPLAIGENFIWDTPESPVSAERVVALPDGKMFDAPIAADHLLATVGARPKQRDAVDTLLIKDFEGRSESRYEQLLDALTVPRNYRAFTPPHDPLGDADTNGISNMDDYLDALSAEVE